MCDGFVVWPEEEVLVFFRDGGNVMTAAEERRWRDRAPRFFFSMSAVVAALPPAEAPAAAPTAAASTAIAPAAVLSAASALSTGLGGGVGGGGGGGFFSALSRAGTRMLAAASKLVATATSGRGAGSSVEVLPFGDLSRVPLTELAQPPAQLRMPPSHLGLPLEAEPPAQLRMASLEAEPPAQLRMASPQLEAETEDGAHRRRAPRGARVPRGVCAFPASGATSFGAPERFAAAGEMCVGPDASWIAASESWQSLWTSAVPSEEARWSARAAGWRPGSHAVGWDLRFASPAALELARRAPLLARAAPFFEPSLLGVALHAGARLLAAEAPLGDAPDARELGAVLTLLARCERPPEDLDDVLTQRTWVTLFSAPWWPLLRALPPGALTRAWRAAAALGLNETAVLPLAEEAAQRGANEGAEARRENWGDESERGSLAAAAAHLYAERIAPFLELLQGRHVNEGVLHGDCECGCECHFKTNSFNPAEWFDCTCANSVIAGLATWGAPTLPPSLLLVDIEEAREAAARAAPALVAPAPDAPTPDVPALSVAAPHAPAVPVPTPDAPDVLLIAPSPDAPAFAPVVPAPPTRDALVAPAPDAPSPAVSVLAAPAPAAPAAPIDFRISLGWTIALGARGLRAGGLRSIEWLAAFGHKTAARHGLLEYVRRRDAGGADAERDKNELGDVSDLFTSIMTSVALTGSVERARWAAKLAADVKITPPPRRPAFTAHEKLHRDLALAVLAPAGRAGHLLLLEWGAERGGLRELSVREYENKTRWPIEEALRGGCTPALDFWLEQERRVWDRPEHDFALSFRPQDGFDEHDQNSGTYGFLQDDFFGRAGVLKWAAANGVARHFQDSVLIGAAMVGDLDGLRAVLTRPDGSLRFDCAALPDVVAQAARSGKLELLQWLMAACAPFNARAFFAAALSDEAVAVLRCLLSKQPPLQLTVDEQCEVVVACFHEPRFDAVAAKLAILRGAGFAWDARTYDAVRPHNSSVDVVPAALDFLLAEGCPRGDAVKQADIVKNLIARLSLSAPRSRSVAEMQVAAYSLEKLLDAGFPPSAEAFTKACSSGGNRTVGVALLNVLFERSCVCDAAAATLAAATRSKCSGDNWYDGSGDSITVLTWLEEHGLLMLSPAVAEAAAKQMSPDLIAWLAARSCPLDASFAIAAVNCANGKSLYLRGQHVSNPTAIAAAELAFLDAVLALRPPLDVRVARVAARSIRVVATAIEALTRLHAAGCAIDASVAFFVPLPPQQPFLAVNHVVRWLCISGGVSLAAMGAGACAFFEERTRQLRRNEKGAARRAYDQRARVHREWLVAHGCGCGGALHAGAGAPAADALCYVCRDELLPVSDGSPPLVDCDTCGAFAHQPCVDEWLASCGVAQTCAHCRSPWEPGSGWPRAAPAPEAPASGGGGGGGGGAAPAM
jgi:hypothetical protein